MAGEYPVAFILAWLWCLIDFVYHAQPRSLFASTLTLGAGFYGHPSSVLMMPPVPRADNGHAVDA